jgi:class 3 adenylate cyclase/tetratricopeptide (TPR) repeat protein
MPVCAQCGQENPDVAKFCFACGSPLAAAEPAPSGEERKLITAVFCDLVGSTARAESLDIEDVKALVAPYHARVRTELERHGGTFEKFSGDAILALFGTPRAHEDDPERAVRAGLAVREALAQLNAEDKWLDLHFRIGINTGEALVMLGARPSEGEWSAAGDVMNTAARIESAAPVDGILVGEPTYRATRDFFEFRKVEPIAAKGKAEPVPVWEVVAPRDGAAAAVRPGETRLVGREHELERVLGFCEAMRIQSRPAFASLVGPPGIGKSRLLAEVLDTLRAERDVYVGRCLSYGEGITYWPVEEIIKDAAAIGRDDDEAASSDKLGSLLASLPTENRDDLRTIAASLANLIGAPTTPEGTYAAAAITQSELHWGIRRLFELLAQRRPTVVVVEDLHWAEPTLLELLAYVTESGPDSPLLVLASARPETKDSGSPLFSTGGSKLLVELDALGREASAEFVGELARNARLDTGVVRQVLEKGGGNPLFLEETIRMLAEAGTPEDDTELPVPSTLQALIASRLDQLLVDSKRVAQHASVIGVAFWPAAIEQVDDAAPDLEPALSELTRRDLVRKSGTTSVAGEHEYAFKHILIRDVAYGQLPKKLRAVLHRRVAGWVNGLPGGRDEFAELVAYHLEQACLIARSVARPSEPAPLDDAVRALMRAAEKSQRREGTREADRFYLRALDLVGDERSEVAVELRLNHARMVVAEGDLPAAAKQLQRIAEDARAADRADLRCQALVALANVEWKQGGAGDWRGHLEEAESTAQGLSDRRLQVRVAYEAAYVRAWFEGDLEPAITTVQDALAIAEELDDLALRIEGHMRLGSMLVNSGRLAEADEHLSRCVQLAAGIGSFRDEARATSMLGFVKYYRGETELAEELAERALEWLERTLDSHLQIQNLRELARYALRRGDAAAAERRLRDALPLALDGGGYLVLEVYRYLVAVLLAQGRIDDARQLLAFAARSLPEEDAYARAAFLLAEANVAAATNERTAAATSFSEALRLLEEQQLVIDLGEARLELARALQRFGDLAGARTEFERARVIFVRTEARGIVEEIDRELTALAEGAGTPGPLQS